MPTAQIAVAKIQLWGMPRVRSISRNKLAGETDNAVPSVGSAKLKAMRRPKTKAPDSGAGNTHSVLLTGNSAAIMVFPASASNAPRKQPSKLEAPPSMPICSR